MNKNLLTATIIFFCSMYVVNAQCTTDHKSLARVTIARATKEIIEQEKRENKCKLTDAEMEKTFIYFLKKNKITLSSFSAAALSGNKIVDGLYMVIKDKKMPQEVYQQLDMAKYGISKEVWTTYTKKYKDIKAIDSFKKYIPNNMDIVIETGKKQFGSKVENWLLFEKIIMDFDAKYPKDKNLTLAKKEKNWWAIALKKYKLAPEAYNNILNSITLTDSLSTEDQKIMKEYFKNQNHGKEKK